jgi:hypothetical protein
MFELLDTRPPLSFVCRANPRTPLSSFLVLGFLVLDGLGVRCPTRALKDIHRVLGRGHIRSKRADGTLHAATRHELRVTPPAARARRGLYGIHSRKPRPSHNDVIKRPTRERGKRVRLSSDPAAVSASKLQCCPPTAWPGRRHKARRFRRRPAGGHKAALHRSPQSMRDWIRRRASRPCGLGR